MLIFRWIMSQTVRDACAVRKHYRRMLAAHDDLLSTQARGAVLEAIGNLNAALTQGHQGSIRLRCEELQFAAEKWIPPYPNAAWRENVEVLLVALAVAMGIRTFFLQPFKIPTGSMQPTLFGITASPDYTPMWEALNNGEDDKARAQFGKASEVQEKMIIPEGWNRVAAWLKGISYIHFVAPVDGSIESVGPVQHFLIFNLWQNFVFAGQTHTLWFPPDYGETPQGINPLSYRAGLLKGRVFHKGEDVIKLQMGAGDHLFVDRLTYNFHAPRRGDIIVFETLGIPEEKREIYGIPDNEFYIKRLVGLPGEKVQIGDDRHLVINGVRLDKNTPHFENLYGFDPAQPPRDSQWSGHLNGAVAREYNIFSLLRGPGGLPYFPDGQTVVDVPDRDCMPMGDNTCNSLDSRFWGPIPEDAVIGKSFFVYWPLTGRFGLDNH